MSIHFELMGDTELSLELIRKSLKTFNNVANDSLTEMFNRADSEPYTPIDSGELRLSREARLTSPGNLFNGLFGYVKEYAGHVEYGHRTRNGGYVKGQYYLKKNVDIQKPIYRSRLIEEMEK